MISFGFSLSNPWMKRHEYLVVKSIQVTKNKTIDITLLRNTCIVAFNVDISNFTRDHAGFTFDVGLLGYWFDFSFYDNRHYDE